MHLLLFILIGSVSCSQPTSQNRLEIVENQLSLLAKGDTEEFVKKFETNPITTIGAEQFHTDMEILIQLLRNGGIPEKEIFTEQRDSISPLLWVEVPLNENRLGEKTKYKIKNPKLSFAFSDPALPPYRSLLLTYFFYREFNLDVDDFQQYLIDQGIE